MEWMQGKTLSILCGTLSWLKRQAFPYPLSEESIGSTAEGEEGRESGMCSRKESLPTWVTEQYERQKNTEREERVSKIQLRLGRMHERHKKKMNSLRKMQATLGRKRRKMHSAAVEKDLHGDIMREIGISDQIACELSSKLWESSVMDADYQTDEESASDGVGDAERIRIEEMDDSDDEMKHLEDEKLPHIRKVGFLSNILLVLIR
jgi:hypothetical protein